MSLILDALRKAEAERKLGRAPTLASVSPWRVQRRVPLYAVVMIALLGAGAALGGLLWLSRREPPASQVASAPPLAAPAPARPPAVPARTPAETGADPSQPRSWSPPAPSRAPAQPTIAQKAPRPAAPSERLPTVVPAGPPVPHLQPETAPPAKAPPEPQRNEVIPPAASLPPPPARISPPRPSEPEQAAATAPAAPMSTATRGALADLKLTMHYYNADPARRFVILNGERYGEGQSTDKGMKVSEIRVDGVVIEYHGEVSFLPRGGG